jgi:hypothetical protein
MSDIPLPPALEAAHALDPELIEKSRAHAARLVAGLEGGYKPDEEPAHIYQAGGSQ